MDLVVWNIVTGENIEFFFDAEDTDEAIEFIRISGNENYKITSCS